MSERGFGMAQDKKANTGARYATPEELDTKIRKYFDDAQNNKIQCWDRGKLKQMRQPVSVSGMLNALLLSDAAWKRYLDGTMDGLEKGECPENETGTFRFVAAKAMRKIKADIIEKTSTGEISPNVGAMLLKADFGYGVENEEKPTTINIVIPKELERECR